MAAQQRKPLHTLGDGWSWDHSWGVRDSSKAQEKAAEERVLLSWGKKQGSKQHCETRKRPAA